jgi:hypothetical protein
MRTTIRLNEKVRNESKAKVSAFAQKSLVDWIDKARHALPVPQSRSRFILETLAERREREQQKEGVGTVLDGQ